MFATASGKLRALTELTNLTVRQKIALGGAGALTPIILNLLVVDASRSLREITFIVAIGYVLKVVSLFYLGGMTAALHRQEHDPLRVFELGIVAPALLTTFINGSRAEKHDDAPPKAAAVASALTWLLPPDLVAAEIGQPVYSFRRIPQETIAQQFIRGLVGQTTRGSWFVCLRPTELGLADATRVVDELRRRFSLSARVYSADGGPSGRAGAANTYTVVLADWTSEDGARTIGQRLREQGVANAFEWMRPSQ
jgi:hypothetical protein